MRKMVRKSMRRRVEKTPSTGAAINKGSWTAEEDRKLADYVRVHGDKKWRTLPMKAGLNRCGKSCRLRWLNYLRPGIKRGNISEDEEDLIIRLHNLLGNKWSLIAGRLPGRTDNEIKNHWNSHLSKKALTIHDLNSKQCQGHGESLHTLLPPIFPSLRQSEETLKPEAVGDGQTSSAMLELRGLLSMPSPQLLKEVEYGMEMLGPDQEQCQSFSMLSFQPPSNLESFAFEEVMGGGYMDCEGYDFLYFPPL